MDRCPHRFGLGREGPMVRAAGPAGERAQGRKCSFVWLRRAAKCLVRGRKGPNYNRSAHRPLNCYVVPVEPDEGPWFVDGRRSVRLGERRQER